MGDPWAKRLAGWIAWNHEELERSLLAVAPELFAVRPARTAPSIAFQGWHVARWVDLHVAAVSSWLDPDHPEPQVWEAGRYVERWGLTDVDLGGYGGTGEGLGDDASAALPLPGPDEVIGYAVAAFRAFDAVLGRLTEEDLGRTVVDMYGDETDIAEVLLNHLSHADRHLGMIEALRGVVGERGTATV